MSPSVETPPRTWGKQPHGRCCVAGYRNTPTDVGKTYFDADGVFRTEKHPHGRGENRRTILVFLSHVETPPRTWGKLLHIFLLGVYYRNTPTDVGKT